MSKSRKRRNRERRIAAESQAELRKCVAELEADGVRVGMTFDEAMQLIATGARVMRDSMSRSGLVTKAQWTGGGLTYHPDSLVRTIESGIRIMKQAAAEADAVVEKDLDLPGRDAARILHGIVSGMVTVGAAALLYLHGCAMPYDLARFLAVDETDGRRHLPET